MKNKTIILSCLTGLILVGCQTRTIPPSEIKCYGTDPLMHTTYRGSDESYHYISWQNGKASGIWRVDRESLHLPEIFSLDSGRKHFVIRNDDGQIDFMHLR